MSLSWRRLRWPLLGLLLGSIIVVLARSTWGEDAYAWIAREQAWLARLIDRYQILLWLPLCWLLLREPQSGSAPLLLCHATMLLMLLELSMGWFLGVSLGLLVAVGLVARPWPNRAIMAHCVALAGLAIVIDTVIG